MSAEKLDFIADVITYVGIPLAVAGGVPIIWNALKCIYIRFKLSQTLPWELRPYFYFTSDLVGGTVTVHVQEISLSRAAFWTPDAPLKSIYGIFKYRKLSFWDRHRSWRHRVMHFGTSFAVMLLRYWWFRTMSFLAKLARIKSETLEESIFADNCQGWDGVGWTTYNQVPDRFTNSFVYQFSMSCEKLLAYAIITSLQKPPQAHRDLGFFEPRLLSRPWMMLALGCDFQLTPLRTEWHDGDGSMSFNVDLSMQIPAPRLTMNSDQFIWFSLCSGIPLSSISFLRAGGTFGQSTGLPFDPLNRLKIFATKRGWAIEIQENGLDRFQFSLRRGLAVGQIMLLQMEGVPYVASTKDLPWYSNDSIRPAKLGSLNSIHDLRTWTRNRLRLERVQNEHSIRQGFEQAFSWANYCMIYGAWSPEFGPSKNAFYELSQTRKKSLFLLYLSKEHGCLQSALNEICLSLVGSWSPNLWRNWKQSECQTTTGKVCKLIDEFFRSSEDFKVAIDLYKNLKKLGEKLRELEGLDEKSRFEAISEAKEEPCLKTILLRLASEPIHKADFGGDSSKESPFFKQEKHTNDVRKWFHDQFVETQLGQQLITAYGPEAWTCDLEKRIPIDILDPKSVPAILANVVIALCEWPDLQKWPDPWETQSNEHHFTKEFQKMIHDFQHAAKEILSHFPGLPSWFNETDLGLEFATPSAKAVLNASKSAAIDPGNLDLDNILSTCRYHAEHGASTILHHGLFQPPYDELGLNLAWVLEHKFDQETRFEFV